ncbi:unnamed protein product [Echinostoma caproni]|uniref:Uncharacterized protein n=1 Tax=Echinostoma caproni TaxID=27848 RepID=A0A183AT64_9TREM|nr:unnamed protein product [Echinostoma caproni]
MSPSKTINFWLNFVLCIFAILCMIDNLSIAVTARHLPSSEEMTYDGEQQQHSEMEKKNLDRLYISNDLDFIRRILARKLQGG